MTQATQIVHWPGKDTPMCDKHAAQAKIIANAMGFTLSSSRYIDPAPGLSCALTCKNCDNEARQHANRPTELP